MSEDVEVPTPTTNRTIRDVKNNISIYPEELKSIYLDFNRNKNFSIVRKMCKFIY